MASTFQNLKLVTMQAQGNLGGRLYHAVKLNSNGRVELVDHNLDVVIGVIAEDPGTTVTGDDVLIHDIGGGGTGVVAIGVATNAGQLLHATTTDGLARGTANLGSLSANQMAFGVALDSGSAGDVIRFKAMPIGCAHT